MDSNQFKKIESIFEKAVDLSLEKREEYLLSACDGNEEMLKHIRAMLKADENPHSLLDDLAAEALEIAGDSKLDGKDINQYHILRLLGEGGMGEVYLAEDSQLDRLVALKFLPQQYLSNTLIRARFLREARAAARLVHPNIITIHEISEFEKRPFIAMEYVPGKTARDIIRKGRPAVAQVLDLVIQVCEGLSLAHRRDIIHRDIKPENIKVNEEGLVKVLDFGIAYMVSDSQLTRPGTPMGTPCYMSPEQGLGKPTDKRTDIYSTGILLFELLTGSVPFLKENVAAIIHAIVNDRIDRIGKYNPNAPEELQLIVDKATAKDPNDRYSDIEELKNDLEKTPLRFGFAGSI